MSQLFLDNFTGADATNIVSGHTPDAGAYKYDVAASGGTFRLKTNMAAFAVGGGGTGKVLCGRNNANVDLGASEHDITLNFHNYDNTNSETYEVLARYTPGSSSYYRIIIQATGVQVTTPSPAFDFGVTTWTTWTAGSDHTVVIHVRDASLKIDLDGVEKFSATTNLIGGSVGTNDYVALQSVGAFGGGQGVNIDSMSIDTPTTTLSASTPAIVNATLAGWETTASSVAPTGFAAFCPTPPTGTPPYTYQWHVSTTTGFTPSGGTLVSGATSQVQAFTGLASSTTYYAKCVITDAVPDTVTTSQVSATTLAAIASDAARVITMGDSTGELTTAAMVAAVNTDLSRSDTVGQSCSLSGKQLGDFTPSNSNNWLKYVCAIAKAWVAPVINDMLRINDAKGGVARSNSAVSADTDAIDTYITGQGLKVMHHYVLYNNEGGSGGTTANTLIGQYNSYTDSKVNGSTILQGDQTATAYYAAHTGAYADGLHLSDYADLGQRRALAFETTLGPSVPTNTTNASDTTGTVITATFSEAVVDVLPGQFEMSDGFRVRSLIGSGTSWDFTITPALVFGDAPTLDYIGTSTVSADDATLAMETFSGHVITNNVPDPALSVPDAPILTVAEPVFAGIAMDMEAGASDGGYPIIEFEVWRDVDSGGYAKVATIPNDIAVVSGYFDNTTTIGQVVKYKARTRNWAGFSPFSDESDGESAGPVRPYIHFAASVHLYRGLSRALS